MHHACHSLFLNQICDSKLMIEQYSSFSLFVFFADSLVLLLDRNRIENKKEKNIRKKNIRNIHSELQYAANEHEYNFETV